jgi:uncharacterized protein (DUF433 family)
MRYVIADNRNFMPGSVRGGKNIGIREILNSEFWHNTNTTSWRRTRRIQQLSVRHREKSMNMNYQDYIARDPEICGRQSVVMGTRIPIRTVLASLAEGSAVEEILADFPTLTEQAVRAVIAFAAVSAEEDLPVPSVPGAA